MSCWNRCLWMLVLALQLAACTGTETDNPTAGEPPPYRSPTRFVDTPMTPGCVPPLESGKPSRLPLWGHDGSLVAGADRYSGLRVIDAGDPRHPRVTSELALNGEPRSVLVQGSAITLAIDEVPVLNQSSVPEPASFEPVTRLVRYDASDPGALVRVADVAVEGELWRVQQRGELTWVMSAELASPTLSCDRPEYSCGSDARAGLILTAYRFAADAWEVVQRVELRMNERAWSTPEGFAAYEAQGDAEGNAAGGTIRAVRFGQDGLLGAAVELRVPPQLVWEAPLSLAGDQARVFLRDPQDGLAALAIFDLATGEMRSLLRGIRNPVGPGTRFTPGAVYIGDEGSQQGALFVDTRDAGAPIASSFPAPIAQALALDDDGTRVLGVSADPNGGGLAFTLLRRQDGAMQVIARADLPGAAGMPDSKALWVDGDRVFYDYQRSGGGYALGVVVVGESSLTPIAIVADGYPDDLVPFADTVYVPDAFGVHVVPLEDGGDGPRLDWSSEVSAYAFGPGGAYEAALVQRLADPVALDFVHGDENERFEVSPGAAKLIADGTRLLVLSTEPRNQCEQTGRDCSEYAPNVEVYRTDGAPRLLGRVPLPDADLIASDDDHQVRLEWETVEQGLPLGGGRFLFVAELDATCTTEAACRALGITPLPIGQAGVNVALPGTPATCPPGVAQCPEQPPAPAAPTVYGEKRSQRLYVLDASGDEPSFGPAAESTLGSTSSSFGPPRVAGGVVIATRLERDPQQPTPGVSSAPDRARVMIDRFELGDGGALRALPELNVPGYPLALRGDGAVLFTVEPDTEHEGGAVLHQLALRENGAHLRDSLPLPARYADLTGDGARAIYLRRDGEGCSGSSELLVLRLPDDENAKLAAGESLALPGVDWSVADVRDDRVLLVSGAQRFAVVDVSGERLELRAFASIASYIEHPQLNGDAIVGAGMLYGEQRIAF